MTRTVRRKEEVEAEGSYPKLLKAANSIELRRCLLHRIRYIRFHCHMLLSVHEALVGRPYVFCEGWIVKIVILIVIVDNDERWKPSTAMLCHDHLEGLISLQTMKTEGMELIISHNIVFTLSAFLFTFRLPLSHTTTSLLTSHYMTSHHIWILSEFTKLLS